MNERKNTERRKEVTTERKTKRQWNDKYEETNTRKIRLPYDVNNNKDQKRETKENKGAGAQRDNQVGEKK